MGKEIDIELFDPHEGQIKIMENARRFNVIVCGRRFGKTEFCVVVDYPLIAPAVFEGKMVGVFVDDFKDFSETWDLIVDTYKMKSDGGIISYKDETKKRIKFASGGLLVVWSINNDGAKEKGRSRKYHRIIYEETQKIKDSVLEHHFKKVARPTLMDYKGDCWFIGTANGKDNYFYQLAQRGSKNAGTERNYLGEEDLPEKNGSHEWYTHRMTTYENPFIDPEEIESMKDDLDSVSFAQEVLCSFVDYSGMAWCYALGELDAQRRVFVRNMPKTDILKEQIYIGFDFNKVPMTALVMKKTTLPVAVQQQTRYRYGIHFIKEFKIGTKQNEASIYDTCQAIREWVYAETGRKIGIWDGVKYPCTIPFMITGDASGKVTSGLTKVPIDFYRTIQNELQVTTQQLYVPGSNPLHAESYVQVNTLIEKNPDFKIYEDLCPGLRTDTLRIKGNNSRQIVKARGEERQADLLDCMRYLINSFCKDVRI